MRISFLAVFHAAALLCAAGCSHTRISAIVSVGGGVHQVVTRNRYKLVFSANSDGKCTEMPLQTLQDFNNRMKKHQPNVFADDGMPYTVSDGSLLNVQNPSGGNPLLVLITLGMFPSCQSHGIVERCTFDVLRNPDARATFEIHAREDSASSLSPLASFCYNGDPDFPKGCENGSAVTWHSGGSDGDIWNLNISNNDVYDSAKAYAIAALLKKMEDDGRIDVSHSMEYGRTSSQTIPGGEEFEVVDFTRDGGCEHRYSFTLKRRGGGKVTMREARDSKKALTTMVREDYLASFPDAAHESLVVDFPEFALRDGMIVGKSAVLSLSVQSLKYDANTHIGVMRIRIGENQFEDARRYARRNIESLVRDKNVALDAKAIPASATFYLRDETLENDVLEITFKAE